MKLMAIQPFKSAMAVVKIQTVAGGNLFSVGPGSFNLLLPSSTSILMPLFFFSLQECACAVL